MAWGYRLEFLGPRELARLDGRGPAKPCGCSVRGCGNEPRFRSAYRYVRASGRAVTATRPLCVHHARRFSMKYSLAWPQMLRRVRRPLPSVWALAA